MPTMTVGLATEGSKGDTDSSFGGNAGSLDEYWAEDGVQLLLTLADDDNESGAITGLSVTAESIDVE